MHAIKDVVNTHKRIDLANTGDQNDIARIVRLIAHLRHEFVRRSNGLEGIQQLVATVFLLHFHSRFEDVFAFADAVIIVVPGVFPVTKPVELTVAIAVLLDFQVAFLLFND